LSRRPVRERRLDGRVHPHMQKVHRFGHFVRVAIALHATCRRGNWASPQALGGFVHRTNFTSTLRAAETGL
jgi:hypothetical protein